MKVVILAGGLGTRISEETNNKPKPMVKIGPLTLIEHIMNIYSKSGITEFIIATGYMREVIENYFEKFTKYSVTPFFTGESTQTGGRIKRCMEFLKDERILVTYGDGLANVDINQLIEFHKTHGKMVTITAVRPTARFGELELIENKVNTFKEKPTVGEGWINGGFIVVEPSFFDFIENDQTYLEREPLEKVAKLGQLMAFKHEGFWQCMDTKRDLDYLNSILKSGQAPWLK